MVKCRPKPEWPLWDQVELRLHPRPLHTLQQPDLTNNNMIVWKAFREKSEDYYKQLKTELGCFGASISVSLGGQNIHIINEQYFIWALWLKIGSHKCIIFLVCGLMLSHSSKKKKNIKMHWLIFKIYSCTFLLPPPFFLKDSPLLFVSQWGCSVCRQPTAASPDSL